MKLASSGSDLAEALGATELTPGESFNVSAGLTFDHGPWRASLDLYRINIDDRIVLSSSDLLYTDLNLEDGIVNEGAATRASVRVRTGRATGSPHPNQPYFTHFGPNNPPKPEPQRITGEGRTILANRAQRSADSRAHFR